MSRQDPPPTQDGVNGEAEQTAQATAEQPIADTGTAELDLLRKESQANLDGWQRTLAEFQNFRKRTQTELKDSYQNATFDVLQSLLPIIDDFERAMSNVPESMAGESWLDGVRMIQRKFTKVLDEYNVTIVDPLGEPFDPNKHQAIGTDDTTDTASGHITTTLQKGYVAGDRVLRPALVKVAP